MSRFRHNRWPDADRWEMAMRLTISQLEARDRLMKYHYQLMASLETDDLPPT